MSEKTTLDLLREARGYVEGQHDEGCQLDLEFGQQNFEMEEDERADAADAAGEDFEPRQYPQDAKCTCGTDALLAEIDARLAIPDTLARIEELRSGYGSSLTILCDNEEAESKATIMAVEVCAEWTDWTPVRYYGPDVPTAVEAAAQSRDRALQPVATGEVG